MSEWYAFAVGIFTGLCIAVVAVEAVMIIWMKRQDRRDGRRAERLMQPTEQPR